MGNIPYSVVDFKKNLFSLPPSLSGPTLDPPQRGCLWTLFQVCGQSPSYPAQPILSCPILSCPTLQPIPIQPCSSISLSNHWCHNLLSGLHTRHVFIVNISIALAIPQAHMYMSRYTSNYHFQVVAVLNVSNCF